MCLPSGFSGMNGCKARTANPKANISVLNRSMETAYCFQFCGPVSTRGLDPPQKPGSAVTPIHNPGEVTAKGNRQRRDNRQSQKRRNQTWNGTSSNTFRVEKRLKTTPAAPARQTDKPEAVAVTTAVNQVKTPMSFPFHTLSQAVRRQTSERTSPAQNKHCRKPNCQVHCSFSFLTERGVS